MHTFNTINYPNYSVSSSKSIDPNPIDHPDTLTTQKSKNETISKFKMTEIKNTPQNRSHDEIIEINNILQHM